MAMDTKTNDKTIAIMMMMMMTPEMMAPILQPRARRALVRRLASSSLTSALRAYIRTTNMRRINSVNKQG